MVAIIINKIFWFGFFFFLGYTSYSFWVSFLYLIHCLKSIILIPYHQLLLKTSPCPALPSLPSFFHTSSQPASSAKKILPTSFQAIVPVSSVQFSCSVMSDSLRPHEPQHARPPCPSPTTGVHPNPCQSSRWCHPTISFSVIPFSSCPQSTQRQGLFKWVSSSHEVAKGLEFQLQH